MKNLEELRKPEPTVPLELQTPPEQNGSESLVPARQMEELRTQWTEVQSSFVDEPRKAVEEADRLVASAIQSIEEGFAATRSTLEKQWSRGGEVSTEDLRLCLRRYREFFDRLVSKARL